MAPRPFAFSLTASVTACNRFNDPSALNAVAGLIAPTITTGLVEFTANCKKNAVSSRVSVPWVTTPLISSLANSELIWCANFSKIVWLILPLSTLLIWYPAMFEMFRIYGTASTSCCTPKPT